MNLKTCLTLAPLALLAACGTSVDPAAVKETVAAVEEAQMQAIASDDIDGATRIFHGNATLTMPDGVSYQGADSIRAAYQAMMGDPNMTVKVTPGTAWASEGGDLAVTNSAGEYTSTGADGQPATVAFNNQTVWRKADSGPWLIVSDINYPTAPAPAAPAAAPPAGA
jgi:uncharacterized protein (TIGR02246 family)